MTKKKNYIKSNIEKKILYSRGRGEEEYRFVNGSFLSFYASLRRPPSPSDTYRLRADALKII